VHPIFNGIRELRVTGLATRPDVVMRADTIRVRAAGITAMPRPGTVTRLEIRLH
jgi:hypothetical protein